MANSIQKNVRTILSVLYNEPTDHLGHATVNGKRLQELTQLTPPEINHAVTVLEDMGYVDWMRFLGTAPFTFGFVEINPRGRYEFERMKKEETVQATSTPQMILPRSPVGSPYGFRDEDWEIVSERKREQRLYVVFGFKFESTYYDTEKLKLNVENMFKVALEEYKKLPTAISVDLVFEPLSAGYGEHLFNKIARDIISADIAVFDTSDQNPNVMLEMGVALTWGIRVLPIREKDSPAVPSDISGQTWARYEGSGRVFVEPPDHIKKLSTMIEGAVRKKGVSQ
ncbi:Uncharacterised protein [uncultured archaeon]|nr:Uncharacterised protein [uncultured archaeon]